MIMRSDVVLRSYAALSCQHPSHSLRVSLRHLSESHVTTDKFDWLVNPVASTCVAEAHTHSDTTQLDWKISDSVRTAATASDRQRSSCVASPHTHTRSDCKRFTVDGNRVALRRHVYVGLKPQTQSNRYF